MCLLRKGHHTCRGKLLQRGGSHQTLGLCCNLEFCDFLPRVPRRLLGLSLWTKISTWTVTFARIVACNWPTSRTNDATHLTVDLCVVRATSNAYPTRNPRRRNRCQPAINTWVKLSFIFISIFRRIYEIQLSSHVSAIRRLFRIDWSEWPILPRWDLSLSVERNDRY